MSKVTIDMTHGGAVAKIFLNDGKGNVLDYLMIEELHSILEQFKTEEQLKLITFEAPRKHFSFGASVEEHQREFAEGMLLGFHQIFYHLRELNIPTLAKISGQCLGGGLELALMCHQIFADKTAVFGQPEINLGVFPPPASILLPEKIGLSRAEDLLLTGRSVGAEEAFSFGLINRMFDDRPGLEAGTDTWMEQYILPKSASSLRLAMKASRIKFNHVFGNFLPQLEALYLKQLMNTHDANEGIAAFLEKRKPLWTNS